MAYICGSCGQEHPVPTPEEDKAGQPCILALVRGRSALEGENGGLRDVIRDLRGFIGETFYANTPHDEKPLPNSWYKGTSKVYGTVLEEIMARVPDPTTKPASRHGQVADLQQTLWNIVAAWKRGPTPGQGHKSCLCDRCCGVYDAIRAVRVYDSPGLPNQICSASGEIPAPTHIDGADWAICGWCAGTGKEERTSVTCPKCNGAGGKKLEKAGNAWAPNQDYPGKPVTKPTPESALGREMTSMERILLEAVNEFCSCGGAGPENGCTACKIWHRHVASARKV